MPTAPKMVAGLLLAVLAYVASEMIKPLMPDSTVFGRFSEFNALIGFITGWRVIGSRVGRGSASAMSNGLTGTAAMIFVCLSVHAVNAMTEDSFNRKFSSVFEAFNGAIEYFIEYGGYLITPNLLGLFFLGAIIAGMAAEISSHYWR